MYRILTKCIGILSIVTFPLAVSAQTQDITVLEYHPAPGQFVNMLPKADFLSTEDSVCKKCTESFKEGYLVHLGTLHGGYVTAGCSTIRFKT